LFLRKTSPAADGRRLEGSTKDSLIGNVLKKSANLQEADFFKFMEGKLEYQETF